MADELPQTGGRKRGQKSTLTPEALTKICEGIAAGQTRGHSATLAGVNPATLYNWIWRGGKEGASDAELEVCRRIEEAEAKFKESLIEVVMAAVKGKGRRKPDPKLALEILSRRYPEEWGGTPKGARVRVGVHTDAAGNTTTGIEVEGAVDSGSGLDTDEDLQAAAAFVLQRKLSRE